MTTVEQQFRELPLEARRDMSPFLWLHGDDTKERLEMYIGKVPEGGNGSFTVESRPHTDWLGPTWFRDLGICLDAAKKHNLTMWILDEKWWPSQSVGNNVPTQYAAKKLVAIAADTEGPKEFTADGYGGERYIATVAGRLTDDGKIDADSLLDLKPFIHDGALRWTAPAGKWRIMKFTHEQAPPLTQFKQLSVDGASGDCVDWYIRTVYQPHFDHFKDDFGKTIAGFFYDEPETQGDWGTELDRTLAEWGVDWKKAYVAYKFDLAGESQAAARFQYLDAFAETWGRTMFGGITEWCHQHGVMSRGHMMEHNNLYWRPEYCAGDMFRLQRYSDMGGIDAVWSQFRWGEREPLPVHKPLWSTPKLASSISHVFGKRDDLAMVEIFGLRGQDITYPEMKWWTDHMQVCGVNFQTPCSFNPRAPYDFDCPPFFYNGGYEPRWPLYRVYADYVDRLSLMLSGGRHVCPVAMLCNGNIRQIAGVLPPNPGVDGELQKNYTTACNAGKHVLAPEPVSEALQDSLSDCDWLPFDVFEKEAKLSGKEVLLQQERYQVLIVPGTEVIPYETLAKVKAFADHGGIVIGHGFTPTKSATLGKTAADIARLNAGIPWKMLPEVPSVNDIKAAGIPLVMEVLEGETSGWLHMLHRVKSGRNVFFITNQNHLGEPRHFRFRIAAAGVPECWDPMRNEITAVNYRLTDKGVEVDLTLEPNESELLVFQPDKRDLPARVVISNRTVPVVVDPSIPVEKDPEIPANRGTTRAPSPSHDFHGRCELAALPARAYLEADEIAPEAAASITVNGQYVGGFIGKPLRLDVTKYLIAGANRIDITPFSPKSVRLNCQ